MTAWQQNWPEKSGDLERADPPVAPPVASASPDVSPLIDRSDVPLGLTNDGAHPGTIQTTSPTRRRTSTSDIEAIKRRLSARDYAIVESVAEHRLLSSKHIEALHFNRNAPTAADRIARDVTARLRSLRLLGTLDRHIGGWNGGSHVSVHYVDVVGDRILRDRQGRASRRPYEPTERFVRHTLAIADAHIALVAAHRAGRFELVASAVEPASWRRHTGIGGARLTLKPDLYAETATSDDLVHAWFIEIDLGTESIPTLLKKCREYEAYRQTGIEQDRHGGFPIVIWSITHPDPAKAARRRRALAEAIAADPRLPTQLFSVVAPDALLTVIQKGGA